MSQSGSRFIIAAAAVACATATIGCGEKVKYEPKPVHSGSKASLPAVPTLPTKPVKKGDMYTVWGASLYLRSMVHHEEVNHQKLTIEGYVNKTNLMDELKRVHKVMKKVIPEAPHETWLVIDGTLGQNPVQQAREFSKVLDLTGVVITKLDGTAKGGAVFSIVNELKLPIRFIGLGEKAEDLVPFEAKPFVDAILNPKSIH